MSKQKLWWIVKVKNHNAYYSAIGAKEYRCSSPKEKRQIGKLLRKTAGMGKLKPSLCDLHAIVEINYRVIIIKKLIMKDYLIINVENTIFP